MFRVGTADGNGYVSLHPFKADSKEEKLSVQENAKKIQQFKFYRMNDKS